VKKLLYSFLLIFALSASAQPINNNNWPTNFLLSSNAIYSLITNVLSTYNFKVEVTNLALNFSTTDFTVDGTNIYLKIGGTNLFYDGRTNYNYLSNALTVYNGNLIMSNGANSIKLLSTGNAQISGNAYITNTLWGGSTIHARDKYLVGAGGNPGITTNFKVAALVNGVVITYRTQIFVGGILTDIK
jgi:hypothetical protein